MMYYALRIPTEKDRVMQAIVKAALEPEWEARFEANSYGFRPGRCCMDAITQIHTVLNQEGSSAWVLDADIKGCFDNISHEPLLARIPVFDTTIRRWLKAGVVELGHYTDTEAGTPQGGLCKALHNPPYAKKAIMQSNGPKHGQIRCFKTIYFA